MRLRRLSIHTVLSIFALCLMFTFLSANAAFAQRENQPPAVDAGVDVQAEEGSFTQLDGSNSFDPEFGPLTYSWTQISGPTAVISNQNTAILNVTAPFVGAAGATLTFQLTVTDDVAQTSSDTANVNVLNSTDRLTNISTRALVQTGAGVMIGGFIVGGSNPKTVLIRGRGPSMGGAPFNVPGTLTNPMVQLYNDHDQDINTPAIVIAGNDDWWTADPLCASPATSCTTIVYEDPLNPCQPNPGQFTEPPGCLNESALKVTLPPGLYTAIVSGVGGTTGVGIVEVFEVAP